MLHRKIRQAGPCHWPMKRNQCGALVNAQTQRGDIATAQQDFWMTPDQAPLGYSPAIHAKSFHCLAL